MMSKTCGIESTHLRLLIAAILIITLAQIAGTGVAAAQPGPGSSFILANGTLFAIDPTNPGKQPGGAGLTGLNAGDVVVAIAVRPQNGFLYAVGYNAGAGTVQLYAVSSRTGVVAPIGPSGTFVANDGVTPVSIQGTVFGITFDPVTDRLRVVNDAGQNFRINPNTGAFVDGDLGGGPGSVPGLNMDGAINGAAPEVSAAAYTNNEPNATATTLYTLRLATHTLYIQNSPESGTATLPKSITLNAAPLAFTAIKGFGIMPGVNVAVSGTVATGSGIAALTVGGATSLYTIDLTTGEATLIGPIGNGLVPVEAFALQGEPIFGGLPAIGVRANTLVRFNTMTPGNATIVTVTGLAGGEALGDIDYRPLTGQLYAITYDASVPSGRERLYRLDPQTGAATLINIIPNTPAITLPPATPFAFGIDFDSFSDRIKVTNDRVTFTVNPNDASSAGEDPQLFAGGPTTVSGLAFIDSFGKLPGPTPSITSLFGLDAANNQIFSVIFRGQPITVNGTPLDFSESPGFDIPPTVSSNPFSSGGAAYYAYAILSAPQPRLYAIELPSGKAIDRGVVATLFTDFSGLAVGDGVVYPVTVTVTSSQNPASGVQPITFTATISPAHASGTVDFSIDDGDTPGKCTAVPLVGGVATCTHVFSRPGVRSVTATYSGDQNHARRTDGLAQTMNVGTTPSAITLVTGAPNPPLPGERMIFMAKVEPSDANGGLVSFSVDGIQQDTAPVRGGTAVTTVGSLLSGGTHLVTAQYQGDLIYAKSAIASFTVTVPAPTPGKYTQYFAEGATGNFFHTSLGVFNASKTDAANVRVTVFPDSGAAMPLTPFILAPLGRQSIDLNQAVGNLVGISMLVESDQPVAATRLMTWGAPIYGSTLESGAAEPRNAWYFAEGATNVFSLFYLVENPNSAPANVTLTHLLEGGAAPVIENEVVPAFTRRTFYINDVPGLRFAALSTIVTSDQPIVAERAMYLNTTSRLWEGGASNRGAIAPSLNWAFAEGSGGFFHTYLLLANPFQSATTVNVTYQLQDGSAIGKSYDVAAQSRRTVDVNAEDPALQGGSYGIKATSTLLPIVAERAMWWGEPWTDGSAALGTTSEGVTWAIGEGAEGLQAAEATFVLITHPPAPYDGGIDTNAAPVRMTVAYEDGTHEEKVYNVPANGRVTVRIGTDFPNSLDRRFSVLVESIGTSFATTQPYVITVESARYQSPGAFLDAGGAALATKIK